MRKLLYSLFVLNVNFYQNPLKNCNKKNVKPTQFFSFENNLKTIYVIETLYSIFVQNSIQIH